MTKAQLIAAIDSYITINGNNEITGAILNDILQDFVTTVWGDDDGFDAMGKFRGLAVTTTNPSPANPNDYYIAKFSATADQTFTNFGLTVTARELAVFKYSGSSWSKFTVGNLFEGQTLTAAEIRNALETLTGYSRLNKTAILGGEFALNYKGKIDFETLPTISGYASQPGDFFICELGGSSVTYRDGDWAICLEEDVYGDFPTDWLIIPIGSISELTGADVRDALETLSGTNRIEKDYIRGADRALNWRGSGDINAPSYKAGMTDIKKGDFWIYDPVGSAPESTKEFGVGDWVIAVKDDASIVVGYDVETDWYIFKVTREDIFQALTLVAGKIDFDLSLSDKIKYDRSGNGGVKTITAFGKGKPGQTKLLWIRNNSNAISSTKITCTALGSDGIFVPGITAGNDITFSNTILEIFVTSVCLAEDQWIVTNVWY